MKAFFYKLKQGLSRCYGYDRLSLHLLILALAVDILRFIFDIPALIFFSLPVYIWVLYRVFSTNRTARYKELCAYNGFYGRIGKKLRLKKKMWADRNTHKYFKCPRCSASLRVPRGKGKITITCPRCSEKLSKKT